LEKYLRVPEKYENISENRLEHLAQLWLLALRPKVNIFGMKNGNQI
jgi:hypothetical protein